MTSRSAVIGLAMLGSACVINLDPIGDDDVGDDTTTGDGDTTTTGDGDTTTGDGDTTTGDGDTTDTTDTADTSDTTDTTEDTTEDTTDETATGDGDCDEPIFADLFSLAVSLDDEPIGPNLDLDLACTVLADGGPGLRLDCVQFELTIDHQGEISAEIPDQPGAIVHVRLITDDGWFLGERWLRLDFAGASKSVFVIDALTLVPPAPTQWIPPWGLALVDECAAIDDGCGEWVGQTLGIAWEGQTLELLQGESGELGEGDAGARMWVERSWRYAAIDPECDAPSSWQKLAIVSNNLVESDTCLPGESDPCGTGLECCYPCGIPDCDFVCTPEDPDTMSCPPPPP